MKLPAEVALPATPYKPAQIYHTTGDNRTGFGAPETDALIDEIRVTLDEKARNEKYKKLQEIIYNERVKFICSYRSASSSISASSRGPFHLSGFSVTVCG